MTQTVVERYKRPLTAETVRKLEYSRLQAEKLIRREIKCPNCGYYLLEEYGTDHHVTRVKCRKCKFNEIIDTAMFRTLKKQTRYRISTKKNKPLR